MLRVGVLMTAGMLRGSGEVGMVVDAHELAERARYLEELGYSHLWAGDVIGRPHTRTLDPLLLLALAAGSTTKVELGTSILQVPLRYPVELAHRILSVYEMSGQRFLLGAGAGSTRGDFAAVGLDFSARFTLLQSSLEMMRALWRGETVGSACLSPSHQAMGGPEVLIGSWGGRWVERSAQDYDGWIGSGRNRTWGEIEKAVERFRALGGERAVLSSVYLDVDGRRPSTRFDRVQLECTPKEAARRLMRLEDMGFTDVVVRNVGVPEGVEALASYFLSWESRPSGLK